MALTFQHRFVASLVVMSLVVFVLTLATRNLKLPEPGGEPLDLKAFRLVKPSDAVLEAVALPHPEDRIPDDDPWNQASIIAVSLIYECLTPVERSYALPVRVTVGEEGLSEASIEALSEDVEGRLDCISAALYANPWPQLTGESRVLRFWVPATTQES